MARGPELCDAGELAKIQRMVALYAVMQTHADSFAALGDPKKVAQASILAASELVSRGLRPDNELERAALASAHRRVANRYSAYAESRNDKFAQVAAFFRRTAQSLATVGMRAQQISHSPSVRRTRLQRTNRARHTSRRRAFGRPGRSDDPHEPTVTPLRSLRVPVGGSA
jgi:hypothetical protein